MAFAPLQHLAKEDATTQAADPGEAVSIEREFNDDGELPKGRAVTVDSDHPIEDPPDLKDQGLQASDDKHHRSLYTSCYSCWYNWYYGWITYCCSSYGYCGYYYC